MNEHELHEQLARTTAWTESLPVDPAADLARGRRRLRRRRAVVGAGSAFAVALVATGGSLATAHLGGTPDPAGSAQVQPRLPGESYYAIPPRGGSTCAPRAATAPATGGPGKIAPILPDSNHIDVLASYADPDRRHLVGHSVVEIFPVGVGSCGSGSPASERSDWSEAGGLGWAEVAVIPKDRHEPPNDGGIPHPRADVCGLMDDRSTFTKCWVTTTTKGEQVRVGTRGKQAYWASYVRPDGQLAVATVEGDGRLADPGTLGPDPTKVTPVEQPSITLAELISTVTDPTLDVAN